MLNDFRYAVRVLQRSPGFAATAILSMAIGTAACTAVFSVAYTLLLRPLSVPRPQEIVSIYSVSKVKGGFGSLSMPNYRALAGRDDLFEAVGAYVRLPFLLDDGNRSERIYGEVVTGGDHALLGLSPAIGRLLTPSDDQAGAAMVVVLSHKYWEQQFGADPGAIGRVVRLNTHPVEIVGVMPASFQGILLDWGGSPALWVPVAHLRHLSSSFARADVEEKRGVPWLQVTARLRQGISPRVAETALREQATRLAREYPDTNSDTTFSVLPAARARFWPGRRADAVDQAGALFAAVA
ncbi:MAG: ABC transporter permease, partial [Acidobacteriota bacterium]